MYRRRCRRRRPCRLSRRPLSNIFVSGMTRRCDRRRRLWRSARSASRITRTCFSTRRSAVTTSPRDSHLANGGGPTIAPSFNPSAEAVTRSSPVCARLLSARRSLDPRGCDSARPNSKLGATIAQKKPGGKRETCRSRAIRPSHLVIGRRFLCPPTRRLALRASPSFGASSIRRDRRSSRCSLPLRSSVQLSACSRRATENSDARPRPHASSTGLVVSRPMPRTPIR